MKDEKTEAPAFPIPEIDIASLKIEPRFDFQQERAAGDSASTKAPGSPDALEEIAEDMVDVVQRLGRLERQAQETTASVAALQTSFAEHSSYQYKLGESLRRDLVGDRKGLALRAVFDPAAAALDQLEAICKGFDPERDRAAFGQVSAAVATLENLLQSLGFSRFAPQTGEAFDPARMQCLGYVEGDPGVVQQVLRRGYLAGDILVRAAGVLIANPDTASERAAPKEETNA